MPNHTLISERSSSGTKDLKTKDTELEAPEYPLHPLLAQRRSLRAFAARPVEPEILRSLLEAARRAPSSFNDQPWRFLIATHQSRPDFERLLGCLMEFNVRWAQHAPVLLLSVARLNLSSSGESNRHAFHDVGQAMAHLTLQANALGLMVCQMAGFEVEKARETFTIPAGYEPVTVSAIGYPGDPATLPEKLRRKVTTPPERHPLKDFVFETSWGQPAVWTRKQE
jgi:nitroreductase